MKIKISKDEIREIFHDYDRDVISKKKISIDSFIDNIFLFHQPERSKREDSCNHQYAILADSRGIDQLECVYCDKVKNMRCGALNSMET